MLAIRVTDLAIESPDGRYSLENLDYVNVQEGQDFTLPLIEVCAAALLALLGIWVGVVSGSAVWATLVGGLAVFLLVIGVRSALGGEPLYGLVLHRGEVEQVICYSRDRSALEQVADRVRAACT